MIGDWIAETRLRIFMACSRLTRETVFHTCKVIEDFGACLLLLFMEQVHFCFRSVLRLSDRNGLASAFLCNGQFAANIMALQLSYLASGLTHDWRVIILVEYLDHDRFHLAGGAVAVGQPSWNDEWSKQGKHCIEMGLGSEVQWKGLLVVSTEAILGMQRCRVDIEYFS